MMIKMNKRVEDKRIDCVRLQRDVDRLLTEYERIILSQETEIVNLENTIDTICENHDLKKCDGCDEYCNSNELTDTEGMINGGVGDLCESCINDL